jgi:hypothetical protein
MNGNVMRAIEILLKITLVSVYALVVWKGIELSRFALLQVRVDNVILLSARQEKGQVSTKASELGDVLSNWHNVAGVRSDAASASIAIKRLTSPITLRSLEPDAISILTVRPMAAQAWALLAGTRLLSGQPIEKAASALQTALMLAPNEDNLIAERLVYGLIMWEHLSPSAKERIALDLSIVGEGGVAADIEKARIVIAEKNKAVRDDIRARLDNGVNRKALVDKLRL